MIGAHLANEAGLPAEGRGVHGLEGSVGVLPGQDADALALVGQVEGVDAEEGAAAGNLLVHGDVALVQDDADPGLLGDFVERGGKAAARRIPEHVHFGHGVEEIPDQPVEGGRVGHNVADEGEAVPGRHDGQAVVADSAADD